MTVRRIGIVGLGNMGGRLARRIGEVSDPVVGFDVIESASARWGCDPAGSMIDLAERVDLILLSLPNSVVVESVVEGCDGLIANGREGQIIIDLSTAAPASTRRLAEVAANAGITYIDAGVTGGAAAAEKGELTLMVGASEEATQELADVTSLFASRIFAMGEVGLGHSAKLLNNFLNAVTLAATAEVMIAAKQARIDLHQLLDVLNNGSGVSWASLRRFPFIVDGDYLEGGLTSKLMMKDLDLYLDHIRDLGMQSLNSPGPIASFGLAIGAGYGDQISNRVVDAIGDMFGGIRLHDTN